MDLGTEVVSQDCLFYFIPKHQFYLVDSIKKKTECISKIITELNIKNVEVINSRSENLNKKFDYIITRAVAPLSKLVF